MIECHLWTASDKKKGRTIWRKAKMAANRHIAPPRRIKYVGDKNENIRKRKDTIKNRAENRFLSEIHMKICAWFIAMESRSHLRPKMTTTLVRLCIFFSFFLYSLRSFVSSLSFVVVVVFAFFFCTRIPIGRKTNENVRSLNWIGWTFFRFVGCSTLSSSQVESVEFDRNSTWTGKKKTQLELLFLFGQIGRSIEPIEWSEQKRKPQRMRKFRFLLFWILNWICRSSVFFFASSFHLQFDCWLSQIKKRIRQCIFGRLAMLFLSFHLKIKDSERRIRCQAKRRYKIDDESDECEYFHYLWAHDFIAWTNER